MHRLFHIGEIDASQAGYLGIHALRHRQVGFGRGAVLTPVEDMLCYKRLSIVERGFRTSKSLSDRVAGFRLMHLMPAVGSASAQRVLDHMMVAGDPIRALADVSAPPRAADNWRTFVETVTYLYAGGAGWPAELERARLWYEPHLERIHEDAATRRADLIQLEQIACGYPSRERFLTELTLDPPDATSDQAGVTS